MKKIISLTTFFLILLFLSCNVSYAQFDKFIKKKAKDAKNAAVNSVLGTGNNNQQTNSQNKTNSSSNFSKGQKLTPPDIDELINSAQSAYGKKEYANARFDIKEALKGIELEIGYEILEKMPTSTLQLSSVAENDGVISSGIGFVGLLVSRLYEGGDKQLYASIGNNTMMNGMYGMMVNSGYTTRGSNAKNINLQGYRGSILLEQNTYTLIVPFAQSSVLILECRGFRSEEEVKQAASAFDIEAYEQLLMDNNSDRRTDLDGGTYLKTASSNYTSQDLEACRFDLQNALIEVDEQIGKMVLEMLPTELMGLKAIKDQDEYMASSAGFAGVYVVRAYESADKSKIIELSLMDDSPMMAMVSAFMSNPMINALSGQKSIKIDGYKGMYENEEGSNPTTVNINIPNNQSLFSMRFVNFTDKEVNTASHKVPVGKIFNVTK